MRRPESLLFLMANVSDSEKSTKQSCPRESIASIALRIRLVSSQEKNWSWNLRFR